MATNDMVALALKLRAAVFKRDAAALARLTEAYSDIYSRAQRDMDNLINAIIAGGEEMTKGQVQRLAQYKQLLNTIETEVNQFGVYLKAETRLEAKALIAQASKDAKLLIAQALGGDQALAARIASASPAAIETLLGFLDADGELWDYWSKGKGGIEAAKTISRAILENVGLGRNPREWAKDLRQAMGAPLTSALKTARTIQLWSYREASRANYAANTEVVKKWQWVALLDKDTCPACLALHGREFDIEAPTDGHWNCRCVCIPVTILTTDTIESGETWFRDQNEATQKAILGPGKYEAWKNGQFAFAQLAQHADDTVFGSMWQEIALKDLV